MQVQWTNTEWDNFNGVASNDNLMMLNSDDNFLNAGGQGGNDNVDKYSYTGDEALVTQALIDYKVLPSERFSTEKDLSFVESQLATFVSKANDARRTRNSINVTNTGYTLGSKDKKARENANKILWGWDRMEARTKEIRDALKIKIAEDKAKAKADLEAKAKALADAEAQAKLDALNNKLATAKTPEEKASIQSQIDALAGNVAKGTGSSKTLIYGVVGLVVVVGAYLIFKRKSNG